MAELITTEGITTKVSAKTNEFTLDEIRSLLSCSMVQIITLEDGRIMWIDEEGKLKPHFENPVATILLHAAGGMLDDYIAGPALITDFSEVQ
jgi:hypothetical protein